MKRATESVHTLSAAELEEMSAHAVAREFRARTVLMTEGDRTDALYIIIGGRVRAYVSDADGREATLSVMGPGEYFGELAFDAGKLEGSMTRIPTVLLVCALMVLVGLTIAQAGVAPP